MFDPILPDPWLRLRRFTPARIALGRAGGSQPTRDQLAFALDHALARDAVHASFDAGALTQELRTQGLEVLTLTSAAPDRATYLQRPDLGRKLSDASRAQLCAVAAQSRACELAITVSDGLSALAAQRQVPPLLAALVPALRAKNLTLAPICLVRHARVGIMDEIGDLLHAKLALILLGERPGLGTPDSLGAYFEFDPRPGRTNADRNCVSNIRPTGLAPAAAAEKLTSLLLAALAQQHSGIALKEAVTPHPLE